jgi:hypothetical protein
MPSIASYGNQDNQTRQSWQQRPNNLRVLAMRSNDLEIWRVESTDMLPPSQSPNRQECIFILAEEKGGLTKTGQFPIKRDGEKVSTGEFIHFEKGSTEMGMTFSNMFGEDAFH